MPGGAGNGGPMALEVSLEIGPHEELIGGEERGTQNRLGGPSGVANRTGEVEEPNVPPGEEPLPLTVSKGTEK